MFKAGFFNKIGEENGVANIQEALSRAREIQRSTG
jgi:hypothetical protein